MNINERIRYLRKSELKLTQDDFASAIDLSRSNLGNIEIGRIAVTERVIASICREFGVNEEWLRNGTGEMFVPLTRDEQIEVFIGNVLRDEPGDFRRRLISVLSRLTESEWALLEKKMNEIVGIDDEDDVI